MKVNDPCRNMYKMIVEHQGSSIYRKSVSRLAEKRKPERLVEFRSGREIQVTRNLTIKPLVGRTGEGLQFTIHDNDLGEIGLIDLDPVSGTHNLTLIHPVPREPGRRDRSKVLQAAKEELNDYFDCKDISERHINNFRDQFISKDTISIIEGEFSIKKTENRDKFIIQDNLTNEIIGEIQLNDQQIELRCDYGLEEKLIQLFDYFSESIFGTYPRGMAVSDIDNFVLIYSTWFWFF